MSDRDFARRWDSILFAAVFITQIRATKKMQNRIGKVVRPEQYLVQILQPS